MKKAGMSEIENKPSKSLGLFFYIRFLDGVDSACSVCVGI